MSMADTIAVMNKGCIEQQGSATDLYESPQTAFVARFLGISNLLDAEMEGETGDVTSARTTDGAQLHVPTERVGPHAGAAVSVGVRPEKIRLQKSGGEIPDGSNVLRGKVNLSTFAGVTLQYEVTTPGGGEITVICQNEDGSVDGGIGAGQEVDLVWDARHTFLVAREEADA
jgi:spermidine/putrescine transport system ATP-binding protein